MPHVMSIITIQPFLGNIFYKTSNEGLNAKDIINHNSYKIPTLLKQNKIT